MQCYSEKKKSADAKKEGQEGIVVEIIKCTSGTIVIRLGDDFSGIIVSASGERTLNWEGFCISVSSIKQIEPEEKTLSTEDKKAIATSIHKCKTLSMPIEFYEAL